ncbi:hypothetical protein KDH_75300 [Dictyobacter sp. S3.2.2.5]|uniref:Uncharacterized protein n=1 Tax=Dictyobacter halimunensis TaxID=3026934 RepID=A0ABQ6G7B8_9CHLR|nr:hypothetical protein KDH_75300 [Dictyobacter sp. S3.2.2.5]
MVTGLLMMLTLLATGVGLIVDHRVITGSPAWVKPAKFAISFSVYCFTFVWLLSFVRRWKRVTRIIAGLTSLAAVAEMGLIALQAARGVASHFNRATSFDSAVYSTMATFALTLWVAAFLAAILFLFERRADRAFIWSVRLSLVIVLFGMLAAIPMTLPTAAQQAAIKAGHAILVGAHSVGVPDGGSGLPFLGWSTIGGDLRIAHFIGLHALQVLPLIGWFLSARRFPRLRTGHRITLVWTFSLGYLGLTASLFWQAMRGQSLIAPDALTLLTWGGVTGLTLAATIGIVLHARATVKTI